MKGGRGYLRSTRVARGAGARRSAMLTGKCLHSALARGWYAILLSSVSGTAASAQTGACCDLVTGSCFITTAANCTSICSVYQGDNTTCASGCPVHAPTGACCFAQQSGGCQIMNACDCSQVSV